MLTLNILQQPPFNLTAEQANNFMQLAEKLGLTLDGFLQGSEFKPKSGSYSEETQGLIVQELITAFDRSFKDKQPVQDKTYTATAGAPGVGKSTFIEQQIESSKELQQAVYVDPDREALRHMSLYKDMSSTINGETAYDTYRAASNFICNFLFVWALFHGYSVVHGTTSTSERVAKTLLPGIKELGYKINIHVLFASAAARTAALQHRIVNQNFYQNTPLDAKGKVAPVFARIQDAFLAYADTIVMYYNTGKYWLCNNAKESALLLVKFAGYNRAVTDEIKLASNKSHTIAKLKQDAQQEQSGGALDNTIGMIDSWQLFTYAPTATEPKVCDSDAAQTQVDNAANPSTARSFLPSFNRYTAVAATLAVVAAGAAIYAAKQHYENQSTGPTLTP